MSGEKDKLAYRKKVRTYSKRLVTVLSIASLSGYIAALAWNISVLSLYFTIVSTILSALSLALNVWSLTDHFRQRGLNKQLDILEQKKKLTKIYLDVASSTSFLIGGVISVLPLEFSIIPFVSVAFFILGCTFMTVNFVRTMISQPQIDENDHLNIQSTIAVQLSHVNKLACLT